MAKLKSIPSALTIAGSDSGGGAGVQADLKVFSARGVHGLCAITCVTAQNPGAVAGVQAITPTMLERQLTAVATFKPRAIKTGMLLNAGLINVTAGFAHERRQVPLVVDPVMVATSGARLLNRSALNALTNELLPLASLITPNLPEASVLAGFNVRSIEDQRRAAHLLFDRFGAAVIIKGGHGSHREAADIFFDGRDEWMLVAPRLRGIKTHGTGCSFSAAVAAGLALGEPLSQAVTVAKDFITQAIAQSRRSGPFTVLEPFWK